jgi:abortive infection bacteriophage resistance protein
LTSLSEDDFKTGTRFEDILDAYVFDRKLRILLIDAIERIEVAIRCAVANTLALQYGPHWFLEPVFFNPSHFDHQRFISDIQECLKQNRSLTFIKHYNNKYSSPSLPPCWMTFEILPFGKVSYLYKNLQSQKHRQEISRQLNIALPKVFESWIHSVSYLRNLCAHHSRVYNKKFTIKPSLTNAQKQVIGGDTKLYAQVAVIHTLLKTISPESQWIQRLIALFAEHPAIPLKAMGFPKHWEENLFWQ